MPWPSAGVRAFPAGRQHWCPHLQTTPPHHTAQCRRTRTLSWCSFAAMSMTSAMAASSRTPSSLLMLTVGLPSGEWGLGQGHCLKHSTWLGAMGCWPVHPPRKAADYSDMALKLKMPVCKESLNHKSFPMKTSTPPLLQASRSLPKRLEYFY